MTATPEGRKIADPTAPFDDNGRSSNMAVNLSKPDCSMEVYVSSASDEAISTYKTLCLSGISAPAQSVEWVHQWVATIGPDSIIAILHLNGHQVLALALDVFRSGPFQIAQLMGGGHANGNFPACATQWLGKITASHMQLLHEKIAKARPDVDAIAFQRLLPELDGHANPLLLLNHFHSPNISLAVNLEGGFDAVLERSSAKRKRKKHRSQSRKFEAVGPYRRIQAQTREETKVFLDAFFAMKASRFRQMGIANVFANDEIRQFFHELFAHAATKPSPAFILHGFEVDGKLRAVTGASRSGERLICEFGAIADDELAHASPGDFLFFENIQEACEQGFNVYDFSVGDEPYKRQWCDIETQHFDAVMPLTLKGHVFARSQKLNAKIKAYVKNSPTLWSLAKTVRRKTAAKGNP